MVAEYVQRLEQRLPRAVYTLQAGLLLNALGNGAAAPFLVIYLHDVRGISLGVAGLVAATSTLAALTATLAAGSVGDRLGPRTTLLGGLIVSAGAYACYPLIREPWQAFVLGALAGSGAGGWLTSQSSLLATLTPPARRHVAFAQQRVAANLGLGLGGMAGGLIVVTSRPSTFSLLFLGNSVTFLAYGAFVLRVPNAERPNGRPPGSYRAVLRDRAFVRVAVLNLALVAGAISLLNSLAPVFAHDRAGISERAIGFLFLLNTLVVVVAQLPIARMQEGRRRARALAVTAGLWGGSWLLVFAAGTDAGVERALPLFAIAFVVFALGECLYDSVQGPLVADLAPAGLTTRYMAASGLGWQLGFMLGPGAGGVLLVAAPRAFWLLPAAVCAVAAVAAFGLERSLPFHARATGARSVREVVFVCEHGAAKSVIAAAWFERLATDTGVAARALARGTELDPTISPLATAGLLAEGIDVRRWRPRLVNLDELEAAWRVVSFGPELDGAAVERWDDIPPVAEGYDAARSAIVGRLGPLVDSV